MDRHFWKRVHRLPTQTQFPDLEEINPAEAYRKQADAINEAGPLYAELEILEAQKSKVDTVIDEIRTRVLAQNMPAPSSSTRTNDLVEAFIVSKCSEFKMPDGSYKDVTERYFKIKRRQASLQTKIDKVSKRLRAIETMAELCDRIMNWAKHEARLEYRS